MVTMFWSAVVESSELPRLSAGKVLAHSSNWAFWRARFDEEEAAAAAALVWNGTALAAGARSVAAVARWGARGDIGDASPLSPFAAPPVNMTLRGSCLRADPCPRHAISHAPQGVLGADLPVGCTQPILPKPSGFVIHSNLSGGYSAHSLKPPLYALQSTRLATPAAVDGLCAFADDWARRAVGRACDATSTEWSGAEAFCPLTERALRIGVTVATTVEGAASRSCILDSAQSLRRDRAFPPRGI
jgi:hypothetical protein